MYKKKSIHSFFVLSFIFITLILANISSSTVYAESNNVEGDFITGVKSAILIEASTGTVIYEKNADDKLRPASVTKVMTMLLAFEKIEKNEMNYSDIVSISKHAASMGGSQCFFEQGEEQTVDTILKCIEVASGNDAAVAMAEHISGSEEEFVASMNEKAKELNMKNTHFQNACGLEVENHYSSARDIAIMSRELITKYPDIYNYSTIWMDSIVHKTNKGEKQFDLANTNKFLKKYNGACGLKTGYTKEAKYCISAVAKRNDITLIAVLLGADTKEIRNDNLSKLLDYGFSKCSSYTDDNVLYGDISIKVENGTKSRVNFQNINTIKIPLINVSSENIEKKIETFNPVIAPIKKGDIIGYVKYLYNDKVIAEFPILAKENIDQKNIMNSINDLFNKIFVIK